jgi:hypothetical protein
MPSRSGSRRTLEVLSLSALLALSARAQDQRPLPAGAPGSLVAPALRVAVDVSEELDPDRLRDLARRGVVAWVRTRSNTLRDSTLENLARFDGAFVEVRAPLGARDAAALGRLTRVGGWISLEEAPALGALRRVAVTVEGKLGAAQLARLARLRPALVQWRPEDALDLLQWSLFRQVPGRRVLVAPAGALLPVRCEARRGSEPALELHLAQLLALSSDIFPCGLGTRVLLPPATDPWLVQSLVVRDPSVELVLLVGADAAAAVEARQLLIALGTGEAR